MSELANLQICTSKFIFCTTTCRHAVHPLKDHRQAERPCSRFLQPLFCIMQKWSPCNVWATHLWGSFWKVMGGVKALIIKKKNEVLDYLCLSFRLLNDKHPCPQVFIHYDHQNQYVLKNSKTNQIWDTAQDPKGGFWNKQYRQGVEFVLYKVFCMQLSSFMLNQSRYKVPPEISYDWLNRFLFLYEKEKCFFYWHEKLYLSGGKKLPTTYI